MNQNRVMIVAGALLTAGIFALWSASPAHAEGEPTPTISSDSNTVETSEPTIFHETYSWRVTLVDGVVTPVNASHVNWPQTLAGKGDLVPECKVWYQVDNYVGTRAEIDAVVADRSLAGDAATPEDSAILDYGNAFAVTGNPWKFVYGGDVCPVVVTPPVEPPVVVTPPATPALPITGSNDTLLLMLSILAPIMLLTGLAFVGRKPVVSMLWARSNPPTRKSLR